MRRRWAAALASAAVVAVTAIGAPSALATPPVSLGSAYVLDDADVLSPAEESDAQARLEQLKADSGLDLWVVFVDDFTDPSSAEDWANQTAEDNGLGPSQYLLAVATEGRQYYLSADSAGPVSPEQVASIEQERIQPALQENDWPGAVDAAADGLADASSGGSGGTGSGGAGATGGSGWFTWLLVVAVVVIGIVLLVMFLRRRRRPGAPGGPATPPVEQVSVEELERQAASALVETDDALKTSGQELQFAQAQFGEAATVEFEQAIVQARANLDEAFTLKQQLDDATPDSPQDARAWNTRIIALCEQANTVLDEKAEAFDELRRLEQNAPQALATATAEADKAEASLGGAAAHLQTLRSSYSSEALATVDDNPEQARQRIAFAREQLIAARTALNAGDRGEAAVGIRAAEEAVGQAVLLEQAIDKLAADLAAGEQRAAAAAATTQQIDAARAQLAGPAKRPLAALQALEAANQQIDRLVQGIRDAEAQAQRARQMVGQLILQAQAQVSAAEDYITARRGAVGAQARTRLAEAGAALVRAQGLQASDPQQAMQHAQRADQLAGQAIQLAQSDVGSFSGGGMFGGGGSSGGGDGMLGAVLGGILINSMMGGGRSGGGLGGGLGGGFGGGLGGGLGGMLGGSGGRGGGIRPGSFGGGGTRGRRGGGRF